MSNYIVNDTSLTSIANAIRTKGGTTAALEYPEGFVQAIGEISGLGELQSIRATFDSDGVFIYSDDSLSAVKPHVTVFGLYDSGIECVMPNFALSGALQVGRTELTVTCEGLTATVIIPDVKDFYNQYLWFYNDEGTGNLHRYNGYGMFDTSISGTRKGISTQENAVTNRWCYGTDRGPRPAIKQTSKSETDMYAIPIPTAATSVTLKSSHPTDRVFLYIGKYVGGSEVYRYNTIKRLSSWTTISASGVTMTFNADSDQFLYMNMATADNKDPDEEREIVITFDLSDSDALRILLGGDVNGY